MSFEPLDYVRHISDEVEYLAAASAPVDNAGPCGSVQGPSAMHASTLLACPPAKPSVRREGG
jgi:hypothetical protein